MKVVINHLDETTTLADLMVMAEAEDESDPSKVEIEYAGCGSHAIELIIHDEGGGE